MNDGDYLYIVQVKGEPGEWEAGCQTDGVEVEHLFMNGVPGYCDCGMFRAQTEEPPGPTVEEIQSVLAALRRGAE